MAEPVTIWDQEGLHALAEEVIIQRRFDDAWYDEEGNYIPLTLSKEEREKIRNEIVARMSDASVSYLDFRAKEEELRQITLGEAVEMPLSLIKEKYLRDHLKKARNILRKGTGNFRIPVSDDIPDNYLEDLLALRWRENLKLWLVQWHLLEDLKHRESAEQEEATP